MSSTRTLQFFLNELLAKLTPESLAAVESGDPDAKVILSEAMSAIDPTDGGHRDAVARYRGGLSDRIALQSRRFVAWAIPAGTEMTQAVGANGVTVAGNSVFLAVDSKVLVDANRLGEGSSAEIRDRFIAWNGQQV